MKINFKAKIYKAGINPCVDVPISITKKMTATKGYIKIKGTINNFNFAQTLVPVKSSFYRLFVNIPMLKGGKTVVGDTATFFIEQNFEKVEKEYPMPDALLRQLKEKKILDDFNNLTPSRKKDILKYLNYIKTEEILQKHLEKLIQKLLNKEKNIRLP